MNITDAKIVAFLKTVFIYFFVMISVLWTSSVIESFIPLDSRWLIIIVQAFFWCDLKSSLVLAKSSIIDIRDFGAILNDEIDDTIAIQYAINNASYGDTIYIPNGLFHISSLELKSGLKFNGQSQNGAILKVNIGNGNIINANGIDISLCNFTIDSNYVSNTGNGISSSSSSYISISDVTIKNMLTSSNAINLASITDSDICNNTIQNIGIDTTWGAGIRVMDS